MARVVFFAIFFSLILLSSVWIWVGLLLPANLPSIVTTIFGGIFAAAAVSFALVVFGIRQFQWGGRLSQWIEAYFFSFLGINSFMFVWALVASVLTLAGVDPVMAARGCLVAAHVLMLIAFIFAIRGPRLVHISLKSEKNISPLKVVQITDLHIGATIGSQYVARTVNLALQAQPDLIVLTGDIGDGDPETHPKSLRELSRLKAPLGVIGVLGNHEHYRGAEKWMTALTQAGVKMLENSRHMLEWQGKEVVVHGLAAIEKAAPQLAKTHDEQLHIVLSHYPSHAPLAARANATLFLAGHTHGGQFWPWTWVIGFFHRYSRGLYQVENTHVYVSPGTGYWGPPLRLGAPAEVTAISIG